MGRGSPRERRPGGDEFWARDVADGVEPCRWITGQALGMLENFEPAPMGPNTVDSVHLVSEA